MRENADIERRDRRIIVYSFAVALCVFLGPFGTSADLDFWDRLIFWTVSISAVGFFMEICITSALNSPLLGTLHHLPRVMIGAMIGGVPGTSAVVFINRIVRPEHLDSAQFPILWLKVSAMAVVIAGFDLYTLSRKDRMARLGLPLQAAPPLDEQSADHGAEAASEQVLSALHVPRLIERLPPAMRLSQLVSMSMQDHYVAVTTTKGTEMILMRLSDAIDLVDGVPGVQTHRSHWAARDHALRLTRADRRHALVLSDGRSIPVSKRYFVDVDTMLTQKGQT